MYRSLEIALVAGLAVAPLAAAESSRPMTPVDRVVAGLEKSGDPESAYYAILVRESPIRSLADARQVLARADSGDARAAYFVWAFGIESGDKPADAYLEEAAAKGDPYAVAESIRLVWKKDPSRAVAMLVPKAGAGDRDACLRLGAIRLAEATSPEELRKAAALLAVAYGKSSTPGSDSPEWAPAGRLLGLAWNAIPDATPEELAAAAREYVRYLDEPARSALQLRTASPENLSLRLDAVRRKIAALNPGTIVSGTPASRLYTRLLSLVEKTSGDDRETALTAMSLSMAEPRALPGEMPRIAKLLLPRAEKGDANARSVLTGFALAEWPEGDAETRDRVASLKSRPASVRDRGNYYGKAMLLRYLTKTMGTISGELISPGGPNGMYAAPRITTFSDIHDRLAILDRMPAGDTSDFFAKPTAGFPTADFTLCRALATDRDSPAYAEAVAFLKKIADEGDSAACLFLASQEKDSARKLALLTTAAAGRARRSATKAATVARSCCSSSAVPGARNASARPPIGMSSSSSCSARVRSTAPSGSGDSPC